MKKLILIFTSLLLVSTISCTDDFNEINEQPDALSVSDVSAKFFVTSVQQKVFRNDIFKLWYGDVFHSDQFAGHFAGGHSEYVFAGDFAWDYWNALTDNGSWGPYSGMNSQLTSYMNLVGEGGTLENQQYYALGLIIKGFYYQLFTDQFGAIPYSQASDPNINLPVFDDQIDIYKGIIAELDEAISIIGSNTTTGSGVNMLAENDVIFNGNMQNWKKLANSLKLRIALRAHGAPGETFSANAVSEALASGVLADTDALMAGFGEANLWADGTASYGDIWHTWTNARFKIGEPLINIMKNDNDPRLAVIAKKSEGGSVTIDLTVRDGETSDIVEKHKDFLKQTLDNAGLVLDTDYTWVESNDELTITMDENTHYIGLPLRTNDLLQRYLNAKLFSDPAENLTQKLNEGKSMLPTPVMLAADTHFMIAEAILRGLATGDAAAYYQSGLRKAMAHWETISGATLDEINMAPLTGTTDEMMEQVSTQRWIANYTNSVESWSIVRKTGYPSSALITSTDDDVISLAGDLNGAYPYRLRYGTGVYNSNGVNVDAAVAKQGPDVMSTKLWFAK
ncbi:MAG: SusD/RagB family nutrient-binding outer membrane lipoprotein [Flavobacteriaceae bacterium]|nr:SusD/RagB family nutrient-binding outer membrane lipoprotein [Flavobacteriaceae bacterium]